MARWHKNDPPTLAIVEAKFGGPTPGSCSACPCLKACRAIVNTAVLLACEIDDAAAGVNPNTESKDSWLHDTHQSLRDEPLAEDWHGDWMGSHPYPTLRAYLDTSMMMGAAKIDL